MGLAGIIGGYGLSFCDYLMCHEFRRRFVLGSCVVGMISALPFGLWLGSQLATGYAAPDPLQPARLTYSFAIWQCMVGTYLFLTSSRPKQILTEEACVYTI